MTLLVCGGMPKGGTTFLFTELTNYSNVKSSIFKEIGLFKNGYTASDKLLFKIQNSKHILLDFYPEYFFSKYSLELLLSKKINSFFIIRNWDSYRNSLLKYLEINNIDNKFLKEDVTYSDYLFFTNFIKENFLFFQFEDVCSDPKSIVNKVSNFFNLEIGFREYNYSNFNSSEKRNYYLQSFLNNHLSYFLNIKKYLFMYI